jgi:ABC-type dipeptide/oligopeptide/nickel transport system permease subunit/ABC-type transport system substrate-binding protein
VSGPASTSWARFRQSRPAVLGLAVAGALSLFAIVGPWLTRWDPNQIDFALRRGAFGAPPGPSAAHWLGADHLFRDVFARLAAGARVSLTVAVAATALATLIGVMVGVLSGMTEGTRASAIDTFLMRVVDVMLALPFLLIVTAIGAAVGRTDMRTVLLVLGLVGWTGTARLVRAQTMQIRALDFVTAARALGAGPVRIVARHVLPNIAGAVVVVATTSMGQMILAEAVLGYLTVGIQPPQATWGRMLHESESFLGTRMMLIAAPGFAILLSVLAFSRIGDGLRDAVAGGPGGRAAGSMPTTRWPTDLLIAVSALLVLSIAKPGEVAPPLTRAPSHDAPRRGGTLRLASFVNLRALDPALAFDESARAIQELSFARLIHWDPEGRLTPDLAERYSTSADGKEYTFELREGARFHDGKVVLARDVKRSFERMAHPKTPSPGASMYGTIVGYGAFHAGKAPHIDGIEVRGERVVTFRLTQPDATFLPKMTLAFAAPVCASAGAFADAHSDALPCGAGPFRIAGWDLDKGVRLVRHEGYYAPGMPYLDGIVWSVNVPAPAQRYKFERGELDYTHELTGSDRDRYQASPAWAKQQRWVVNPLTFAIFLNCEMPPFDRRAIRRAVSHAVDPSVVEAMRADLVPVDRIVPATIPGPAQRPPMRKHDLALALREMAEGGYPYDPATGKGGYPEPIDYLAIADTSDQQHAEIWQQQLAKIGIRIRPKLTTWATFLAEVQRRKTSRMGNTGWSADFPDPSNFFEPTLASEAIQDEGSENVAFFASHELDALLKRAHAETDREKRDALYERAEEIVRDEAPWIPTMSSRTFELWQPWVRGYTRHAVLRGRFNDVWIDRGKGQPIALRRPL